MQNCPVHKMTELRQRLVRDETDTAGRRVREFRFFGPYCEKEYAALRCVDGKEGEEGRSVVPLSL